MTLRAALIGCGGLGKVHAQMVQPLASMKMVAFCDVDDTHAPFCMRAAHAGKHIRVEKPLALTTQECVEIGRVVEATGVKLMTAFKMRYFDMILKVKELIPNPLMVTMQMMDNRWWWQRVELGCPFV